MKTPTARHTPEYSTPAEKSEVGDPHLKVDSIYVLPPVPLGDLPMFRKSPVTPEPSAPIAQVKEPTVDLKPVIVDENIDDKQGNSFLAQRLPSEDLKIMPGGVQSSSAVSWISSSRSKADGVEAESGHSEGDLERISDIIGSSSADVGISQSKTNVGGLEVDSEQLERSQLAGRLLSEWGKFVLGMLLAGAVAGYATRVGKKIMAGKEADGGSQSVVMPIRMVDESGEAVYNLDDVYRSSVFNRGEGHSYNRSGFLL